MNLCIKDIYCEAWQNGKEIILDENTTVEIQVFVGTEEEKWQESFLIQLCTSSYICSFLKKHPCFSGQWHLVIDEKPTESVIEKYLLQKLERYSIYDTWEETYQKLRLLGKWEFEDIDVFTSKSLIDAIHTGNVIKTKVLLERGVNCNIKDSNGIKPLSIAKNYLNIGSNRNNIIKLLLQYGAIE